MVYSYICCVMWFCFVSSYEWISTGLHHQAADLSANIKTLNSVELNKCAVPERKGLPPRTSGTSKLAPASLWHGIFQQHRRFCSRWYFCGESADGWAYFRGTGSTERWAWKPFEKGKDVGRAISIYYISNISTFQENLWSDLSELRRFWDVVKHEKVNSQKKI